MIKKTLKITGITLGALAVLLIVIVAFVSYYVTTPSGQQRLQKMALQELSEELHTKLAIDSVGVEFREGSIALYNVNIDDQQGGQMLHVDTLYGEINLSSLLRNHLDIVAFRLHGTQANLNKPNKKGRPNFDFLLKAFAKDKEEKEKERERESKDKITFNIGEVKVQNIVVNWSVLNDSASFIEASILQAIYDGKTQKLDVSQIEALQMGENGISIADLRMNVLKKEIEACGIRGKYKDMRMRIDKIQVNELDDKRQYICIDSLTFHNDNGKPRKNEGKPYRGAFDAGHMSVSANIRLTADALSKDSISVVINKLEGIDYASGLIVDSLSCSVNSNMKTVEVKDLFIRDGKTELIIPSAQVTLPSKKNEEGPKRELAYKTSEITGYAVLKDISVPFAPPLCDFTTPLRFRATIEGDKDNMMFRNIHVWSLYNHFTADADGRINNLNNKETLAVHFDIHRSFIKKEFKDQVLKHFKFKEGMVKITENVKDIRYAGALDVKKKWVGMDGHVKMPNAGIKFKFGLDSNTKYIDGWAHIDSLNLGELIGSKDVDYISLNAKFNFDTAGKRAAERLGRKKGKLPAGTIDGVCASANYKGFKLKNVKFDITSNGDMAEGKLDMAGAFIDVSAQFWFVNTDLKHSLRVKPKIRIHGLSKEAREARKKEKEDKKEQKKLKKQK